MHGRDFAAHVPGVLSPQPCPSQTPDVHSSAVRHGEPSALVAADVPPPDGVVSGGGAVDGGVGSTSRGEPGSFVAGGEFTGSGGRAPPDGADEQAATTNRSEKSLDVMGHIVHSRSCLRALAWCFA